MQQGVNALLLFLQVLSPKDRQNDEYGALHASGIHCTGRIVLNVWRILRSELKLNIYTFESCVAAVLQLRTPHVQPHVLTQWFNAGPAGLHTSYSVPALTLTIILSLPPLHVCHHAFVDQCSQTMPRLGLPQRVTVESYTWAHRTEEQLGVLYIHRGAQKGFTDSQSMEAFVPNLFGTVFWPQSSTSQPAS